LEIAAELAAARAWTLGYEIEDKLTLEKEDIS
jgi:hypothetical protein